MLNVVYFCDCLFTNTCRGLHWDGSGHEQNLKAIPVPRVRGRGQRREMCPFPTSKGSCAAQEGGDAAGASSQAHSWTNSHQPRDERGAPMICIIWSCFPLSIWGSKQGAALGGTQDICICFADYRSCTFYFKHQWVATAIQMIWKLLLYTEMSLKQQSKRLAQSFGFYLFSSFHFNKTPQWKTLWWLRNNTCIFEHFICNKLQNIWSLLCNYYDSNFQLKYHSLSETLN